LHLLGSPTDVFASKISILYGGAFFDHTVDGKYRSSYAIVRPDGTSSIIDVEKSEEIKNDVERVD